MPGIRTVATRPAILRDRARPGCVGDEGSRRAVHPRQAPVAEAASKRVVAAGVQDHDIEAVAGRFHRPQHRLGVDALVGNLELLANIDAHRNQVILALELDAMPGVIK